MMSVIACLQQLLPPRYTPRMIRLLAFIVLLSPFLVSQARVSTNGTEFNVHDRIEVQVTNAGQDAVSYCMEVGQTSFKTGSGRAADVEPTPMPFYVQKQSHERWSTLLL